MSSEHYRWLLVDDFVEEFNAHMDQAFAPSEHMCVDESISRWYGQGGHWINMGLPMYVAIDRKPKNGCEIQNAACGQCGVMLRLKLVKTAAEESTTTHVHNDGLQHGTAVLKFLVAPWRFSRRIVCADSYFA
ncbi:transposase IS4 [Nitzschia inconspicua]|uniref:Transposase IS4 n=1 Tax=Nitzschia inconspicua TaxID=303405 RepID=A0A9K3LZ67_9STRA|nr:transposase IS4 [Nitzschia inconspicua]